MATVDIRNFTRRAAPGFPYKKIAEAVAPGWDISLVFAGTKRAQHLNKVLRKKSYVPNVLSYESGKKSGEIIICLEVAKKQAPSYDLSYKDFVAFLFIHGLLHLIGRAHGTTMERHERLILKRFTGANITYDDTQLTYGGSTNRNRH
jgi:rRNA maturation RNase YbeY